MDAVTSIPRAIISYYGRLLGYAVDAGLTVVGLSENIALACIGAALGGMQGTLFLAKTIAYDVTHPSKAHRTAQQQLDNLWGLLPALPRKRSGPRLPQQRRQRPKGIPSLENGEAQIVGAGAGYELNMAAADGVHIKGPAAPAEPDVPIQPLTPANFSAPTGYGAAAGRPHGELFAGQQGEPVGSQLDGLGEPVNHYNVPPTGDVASLASLAGTTRLPGESRGEDVSYEDAFAPGFRPAVPETDDAESAHFKEALAPLTEPGLSAHSTLKAAPEQEGITHPLYQEEEGENESEGRPRSAAGLAMGAVAAGAGAVAGVALGVGSALGLAPAHKQAERVHPSGAAGAEEAPLPLEAAHEMGTELLPEPVEGFAPGGGIPGGFPGEEATALARQFDEPMDKAQDLRHRTAAILQQVEQQPAETAAVMPTQGVWLAGRLPATGPGVGGEQLGGEMEPAVAGAGEGPLPVQVEESGEVTAPPLEEIREVGHVDERECTKPVEPAAIAAEEPVPDTEVSPAPPSSPLPAVVIAGGRRTPVTASRLGPYGSPALLGAVPADGLEGAGEMAQAVLQPEVLGEPLEQVMEAKMEAAKEQVLEGKVPAEGIKRVPSALAMGAEEEEATPEVGEHVSFASDAPAPVLGLTPVGSAEPEQPALRGKQLSPLPAADTTVPADHGLAAAAQVPETPAPAAASLAEHAAAVPAVHDVPVEAPAATKEVATPVETSAIVPEEKAPAVDAVPAAVATAVTTTKDVKVVDEITAETPVAGKAADAAVPDTAVAEAEAAPAAPTTPLKKKRGPLRGPLHKLGKEFKKVFT